MPYGINPFQPSGFMAGMEQTEAKEQAKADKSALRQEKGLDIQAKRVELQEFLDTARDRDAQRKADLLKTQVETVSKQKELQYADQKAYYDIQNKILDAEKKLQEYHHNEEANPEKLKKLKAEVFNLQAEADNFKSQSKLADSQVVRPEQTNKGAARSEELVSKTTGMINRVKRLRQEIIQNPGAIGGSAELKLWLHDAASQMNALMPNNPMSKKISEGLGEAFDVNNIASIRGQMDLVTSDLMLISSGEDDRYTTQDFENAKNLNSAAKKITSAESALPILEQVLIFAENTNKVHNILLEQDMANAQQAYELGYFDYSPEGRVIPAFSTKTYDNEGNIVSKKVHPIRTVPDTLEGSKRLIGLPKGAIYSVIHEDGTKTFHTYRGDQK